MISGATLWLVGKRTILRNVSVDESQFHFVSLHLARFLKIFLRFILSSSTDPPKKAPL